MKRYFYYKVQKVLHRNDWLIAVTSLITRISAGLILNITNFSVNDLVAMPFYILLLWKALMKVWFQTTFASDLDVDINVVWIWFRFILSVWTRLNRCFQLAVVCLAVAYTCSA